MTTMGKTILGFLLIPLLFAMPLSAYSTPLFEAPAQQLDDNVDSPVFGSRVAVSGSNVFSTWLDQCGDLNYARSTDDGGDFTQNAFPISGDTFCFGLVSNGRVGQIANLTQVVTTSVTDDEAMIIINQETATWQSVVNLTTVVISNDSANAGISTLIRSWEIGQIQVTNPKKIYTITGTGSP